MAAVLLEEKRTKQLKYKKGLSHYGMLPVKRTIKNNKFLYRQPFTAGDIFRLRLYIDYDIPLASLRLTSFVTVGCCSN